MSFSRPLRSARTTANQLLINNGNRGGIFAVLVHTNAKNTIVHWVRPHGPPSTRRMSFVKVRGGLLPAEILSSTAKQASFTRSQIVGGTLSFRCAVLCSKGRPRSLHNPRYCSGRVLSTSSIYQGPAVGFGRHASHRGTLQRPPGEFDRCSVCVHQRLPIPGQRFRSLRQV